VYTAVAAEQQEDCVVMKICLGQQVMEFTKGAMLLLSTACKKAV
jgi:hypothetical protein